MEILIVDSDPVNRLVTAALLKNTGCATRCTDDEDEAMDILLRASYDLILMDVDTSGTSGTAIAEAVRKSGGPNALTPMIGLSAHPSDFDDLLRNGTGMDGYLGKPYDFGELLELVGVLASPEDAPRLSGGLSGWWWNMGTVLLENNRHQTAFTDEHGSDKAGSLPGCGTPAQHSTLNE